MVETIQRIDIVDEQRFRVQQVFTFLLPANAFVGETQFGFPTIEFSTHKLV